MITKKFLTRTQVSNESHHNSAIATKNVKGVTIRSQMNWGIEEDIVKGDRGLKGYSL